MNIDLLPEESKPRLDMDEARAEIAAGRTPTCPDCGEALTHVPKPGARLPMDWSAPNPEDHRCDPKLLDQAQRARRHLPGETRGEARRRREAATKVAEIIEPTTERPPEGDEEDV
jgi:hypothetical protein